MIPLTASRTPTRVLGWLGCSAAPGWFVKLNDIFKDLANVATYLDDVIVVGPDPTDHVINFKVLFMFVVWR